MTDKPDQPTTELPTGSPPSAEQEATPEPSVTWEPAAAEAIVTGVRPDEATQEAEPVAPQQTAAFGQEAPATQAFEGPRPGHPQADPGTPPPPAYATPVPPAPRRPPHMTRTWIAAVVAAVLLVGGGVGGYLIGAAGDHRDHGPGWSEQRGGQDGGRGGMPGGGDGPGGR